jgi:methyltransferase family protein
MNILEQPSVGFRPTAFLSGSPGRWANHLPFSADLVAALRPHVLVELGVGYGDSYFGFCQAVAEAGVACTCYGVDLFEDAAVYEAVSRHSDRFYRSFSHLPRIGFEEALGQFSNASIGLLHINAFCTYEGARRGFDEWLPKMHPGGVILLHGISVRSGDHGVWRLWEELSRDFQAFGFRGGDGLGVLRNKGASADNGYLDELFSSSAEHQERIRRYYALCAERIELEHAAGLARGAPAETTQALEQRLALAEEQIERQSEAQLANGKERESVQAAHRAVMQQLAIAKGNVEELTAEIERLTTDQAQSHAELLEARKANSRITAMLEQERVLRTMMENSLPWRLTKPLRALISLLRPDARD